MSKDPQQSPDLPIDRRPDVADQAGLPRLMLGLTTSIFLGLLLRFVLNSNYWTDRVTEAASRLHKNVDVKFDRAWISLAKGFLPDFSVRVEGLDLSTQDPCLGRAQLRASEMRIPLSIDLFLRSDFQIRELFVGDVELLVDPRPASCDQSMPSPSVAISGSASAEKSAVRANSPSGSIQKLNIESIRIFYRPKPESYFELQSLLIFRANPSQEDLQLDGKINLGSLRATGDLVSQAQFHLEGNSVSARAQVKGLMLEGEYQLNLNYEKSKAQVDIGVEAKTLPLRRLIELLGAYGLSDLEPELLRDIWVQGQAQIQVKLPEVGHDTRWSAQIPSALIDGDLGQIQIQDLSLGSQNIFETGQIQLQNLKLNRVAQIFKGPAQNPSLSSLGELKGLWTGKSAGYWDFSGELSGLEFVFSNRSQREKMLVSQALVGASGRMGGVERVPSWKIQLDKIKLVEALFLGQISAAKEAEQDPLVRINIEELSFPPSINGLMTSGGNLGRWSGSSRFSVKKNQIENLTGEITVRDLEVEGVAIGWLRAQAAESKLGFDITAKAKKIHFVSGALSERFLNDNFGFQTQSGVPATPNPLFETASLESRWSPTLDFSWSLKIFDRAESPNRSLLSSGRWDAAGVVVGDVATRVGANQLNWQISGERENPNLRATAK